MREEQIPLGYRVLEMRDGNGDTFFVPQRKGWFFWHELTFMRPPFLTEHRVVCKSLCEATHECCEENRSRREEVSTRIRVHEHDRHFMSQGD